jgi:hypothetical protein
VRKICMKSSLVFVPWYPKRQKVHRSSTVSSKCATRAPTPSVLFLCLKRNSRKSLLKQKRFQTDKTLFTVVSFGTVVFVILAKLSTILKSVGCD